MAPVHNFGRLPYTAALQEYEQQAEELFHAAQSGEEDALWKFKWLHPAFRSKGVEEVDAGALSLDDARLVTAHEYAFETWNDLAAFANAIQRDPSLQQFERAAEATVAGDAVLLQSMLEADRELTRARSARRHHATLLHYVAANGVEGVRQKTPLAAVEIAKLLLDRGAEVDALADMYDAKCTTMSMLVSSCHPANAGLQVSLAETLLDYGAALDGPGTNWQSALMTALTFGYLPTAKALAARGLKIENIAAAAGLGDLEKTRELYPASDELARQKALALAAQLGQTEVVAFLLDRGEDPNRYNPEGFHSHSTPLHQAICAGHLETAKLLIQRGARLDLRDTLYHGDALGWAEHCGRGEIAEFLREQMA